MKYILPCLCLCSLSLSAFASDGSVIQIKPNGDYIVGATKKSPIQSPLKSAVIVNSGTGESIKKSHPTLQTMYLR